MDTKKPAARSPRRAPAAAVGKAADHAAATTAGAARDLVERTRGGVAELAEEGVESVRHAAEQHGLRLHEATLAADKAGEQLSTGAREGAATLAISSQELGAGMQDVGRVWAEFVEDGMRESMAATQSLLRARSFSEAMRIQGEYIRSSFELLLETTAEISDLSKHMLSVTAHRMAAVTPEALRLRD
jgi:hypothetical protein